MERLSQKLKAWFQPRVWYAFTWLAEVAFWLIVATFAMRLFTGKWPGDD